MDKIRDNIFLGSSQDAAPHRSGRIRDAGITAILNLARDLDDQPLPTLPDVHRYHIGIMDGGGNNAIVAACALVLLGGLLKEGHKVLVHCHVGKSRSAALVASYLVKAKSHETIEEAEKELQSIRPRVDIHPEVLELFKSIM